MKGLDMHAPADVRFALPDGCRQFQAQIGFDDETGGQGSTTFDVWAGGVNLYSSGILTGRSQAEQVSVPLSGQTDLRLVVTEAGDGQLFDHADWALARVTCH